MWPLECFALVPSLTHAFLNSCNVSPPGLPIAGMREVSWKKASVLRFPNPPSPPHQSCYSFLGLFYLQHPLLSSSLPTDSSFTSSSLKIPSTSSSLCFYVPITPLPQMLHTVNTPWDPVCLAKCFRAAGWKARSTDLKIRGYLSSDWLTWRAVCGF